MANLPKELVIELPDENEPGYLRRMLVAHKRRAAIRALIDDGTPLPVDYYDSLISDMLSYVSEPKDRDKAREILLELTEQQYRDLWEVIANHVNEGTNPTSPEPTEKN